jgi:conjugal transfer/entry exclusion protein
MNGDQVRDWQIASLKKDIRLFQAMLANTNEDDIRSRQLLNAEIYRLQRLVVELSGGDVDDDTQPVVTIAPDAA